MSPPHNEQARNALFKFRTRAHLGEDLKEIFVKSSQLHPGHTFKYNKPLGNKALAAVDVHIWRLWLVGTNRIYFLYLGNRDIAIIHTCIKAKDDLDDGEKKHLEHKAKQVLDCYYKSGSSHRIFLKAS